MRILTLLAVLALTLPLHADDGAASIGAGGIILMKREPRITMAKEVLRISPTKVIVDYDFRNDSGDNITTLVAFPVPAYSFGEDNEVFGDPAFSDFHLTIAGQPIKYTVETRALVGKRDITALLLASHVDPATFGHWDSKQHDYSTVPDLDHLSPAARHRLTTAGAIKDGEPLWKVAKKYFWTQTFPAHSVVHIQHTYTPVLGGTNSVRYGLEAESTPKAKRDQDTNDTVNEIESLCLEPPLKKSLLALSRDDNNSVPFTYVDFILTTANTWKTPIEDFTLIVERPATPKASPTEKSLISFCWDGPIEKTDATHFTAHLSNFIPRKELRVGFIYIESQRP